MNCEFTGFVFPKVNLSFDCLNIAILTRGQRKEGWFTIMLKFLYTTWASHGRGDLMEEFWAVISNSAFLIWLSEDATIAGS